MTVTYLNVPIKFTQTLSPRPSLVLCILGIYLYLEPCNLLHPTLYPKHFAFTKSRIQSIGRTSWIGIIGTRLHSQYTQGVPEIMKSVDFFTSYIRPFKYTRPSLKGLIKVDGQSSISCHICFHSRIFFPKSLQKSSSRLTRLYICIYICIQMYVMYNIIYLYLSRVNIFLYIFSYMTDNFKCLSPWNVWIHSFNIPIFKCSSLPFKCSSIPFLMFV